MDKIVILDFGSQYTQLIARKIREMNVYATILPHYAPYKKILRLNPKGIILSGGAFDNLHVDNRIFDIGIPILGICYGLLIIAKTFKGHVEHQTLQQEYGKANLIIHDDNAISSKTLLAGCPSPSIVWMSHADKVAILPKDFKVIAITENSEHAAIKHKDKHIYGIQFHPEVHHTPYGKRILHNFTFKICECKANWQMKSYKDKAIESVKEQIGDKSAICALSGGVDSSTAAVIVHKAIGDRLTCISVDTGLLRANEAMEIKELLNYYLDIDVQFVYAEDIFLERLKGITDPEQKRKIIGKTFIEIFEKEADKLSPDNEFLVQGTLYPDVIESTSVKGPSAVIKSHHNVGGLPDIMNLKLVEPLRELFKDEVRELSKVMGVPVEIYGRHPFPGPGLAIRCLGEVTKPKLSILRQADKIFIDSLYKWELYDKVWQAFVVLTSDKSVGVMGDNRTYEYVVALRAVTSIDGMTADWAKLPHDFLEYVSYKILNEVKGVNRVVFDVTPKPPGTIEWE